MIEQNQATGGEQQSQRDKSWYQVLNYHQKIILSLELLLHQLKNDPIIDPKFFEQTLDNTVKFAVTSGEIMKSLQRQE